MTDQFDHVERLKTLVNVRRGWMAMSIKESTKQSIWYLEEYAASTTNRLERKRHASYGSHFFATRCLRDQATKQYSSPWNYCLYRPSSMTKANNVIETGEQLILTVSACVEMIATAKRADPINFPLILRYTDRHCLFYVHCTLPGPHDSGVSADDGSGEDMDISQDEISKKEMKGEDESLAGFVGAAIRPRWGVTPTSCRLD
ncbi:uncharacterized protein CCR75_009301 [Bremia lactucae]|uniref:Uncharacterized protein n=1 Tax=Bremia lactucae TaxID=4779 RepID=A0A976IEQ8_BRELC|nr:hypothetical protein CCR75_007968 [Bremia lactucae]TDH69078.1 hypothetical protein CCR75_009104 [Bremia lactucae]TDH69106.1 hypothetical protein CCR75_009301 [Bremia lactucae]